MTPQDIILLPLSLIVVYGILKNKIRPVYKSFFDLQIMFVAIGILSLLINCIFNPGFNFVVSVLYAFRYLMLLGILFYPAITGDKFRVNTLLFLSGGAVVLIGIPQFLFYNNLRNLFYLGWDDHLYRLFSTFLDPNFVGLFYVIYLGVLLVRINRNGLRKSYIEVIFFLLTLLSIYLTYSRTALIALFVFVIAISVLLKKLRQIIIIVPILILFILIFSNFGVEGLNPFRIASSRDRVRSVSNAFKIIDSNLIYGVGFNSFRYAQLKYKLRNERGAAFSNADAGTDNSLLFVFATSGIVGLFVFIKGYFKILKDLYEENKFESKVYLAVIIALFFGSIFINSLFYIPIMTFIFLMLSFKSPVKKAKIY